MPPASIHGRIDGLRANLHADLYRHGEVQNSQVQHGTVQTVHLQIDAEDSSPVDCCVSFTELLLITALFLRLFLIFLPNSCYRKVVGLFGILLG